MSVAQTPPPRPVSAETIRNIVLVGPSGVGKTTLFRQIQHHLDKTVRPPAREIDRSSGINVISLPYGKHTLNFIDTPGYPDFIGDMRAGLRAADAVLFVVSAADEIDRATSLLWEECSVLGAPRGVLVTKLDASGADFSTLVSSCQKTFGGAQSIALPELSDGHLQGLVPLITGDHGDSEARTTLIEAIIEASEDDSLMERYFAGEDFDSATLLKAVRVATRKGEFFPLLPISPVDGVGIDLLLKLVTNSFPSPLEASYPDLFTPQGADLGPISADAEAPFIGQILRTTADPYVGRLSLIRVFSGVLRQGMNVQVSGKLSNFSDHDTSTHPDHEDEARIGPVTVATPHGLAPIEQAIPGELAFVTKMTEGETSDTVSSRKRPALVEPWLLPEPLLPVAIKSASKADDDKLAQALQRLVAEDITLRLEYNAETHQSVLWTMGQAQVDLAKYNLAERFGVHIEVEPFRTALRETFLRRVEVRGRHVKQSGGHGQFAVVEMRIEPRKRGKGFKFVDKVVGGAVPRQFIPSVEKGVKAQLKKGLLAGYPVIDVKVTLFDGKAHSVDSSDAAFQMAGALALREATSSHTVGLLEPIDTVDITVDDDYMGSVMADLRGRRGQVMGTAPGGSPGVTVITAEVPQSELARYPIDLRSVSAGTGTFTRELARYDYMPTDLAKQHMHH